MVRDTKEPRDILVSGGQIGGLVWRREKGRQSGLLLGRPDWVCRPTHSKFTWESQPAIGKIRKSILG